ncbi:MAG: type 1 glutamine amidotransferase [Propionivibrio sp.]|uniref:type 1 glutamine amidotransferase n=1 Tax=Propionivibrio sp. TaxID=2212460 RepID=UPI001A5AAD41|nr:type 1 glutamine amidotransferase [Propionivibrio sp.]MBL8412882.1 type 1 glutamine amidotransferase [Propionivibrio sp.]
MKPIAIFRHTKTEGPGYFATFLDLHSIPWQLIAIDRGETVPVHVGEFSGLCLMGGPMSVNDSLPWIEPLCALIRDADASGLPVIGHCLGGQLISKALGGHITRSPVKEIGWGNAGAENNDSARHWLGESLDQSGVATVFQWHGETFSIPPGAQRILTNPFCANQMFTRGLHLAMQCHVEMTIEMISEWCKSWPAEVEGLDPLPLTVQTPEQMLAQGQDRLPAMRQLAEHLYSVWIRGLKSD